MENSKLPSILTPQEVADYLKLDMSVVESELSSGNLRGFKAGTEWRTTETYLLEYINMNISGSKPIVDSSGGMVAYETTDLNKIGAFDFKWPGGVERFEYGYDTSVTINSRILKFRLGFTNRQAAGKMRRRIVIWMDNWPLVEMASGNNYAADRLYASVIKVSGRQVRPSETIPAKYKGFRVDKYDSIVKGPYASKNMAVIIKEDDMESMLRHAIIRATDKEML